MKTKTPTPKLKPKTIRLLRKIGKRVTAEPRQFQMRSVFTGRIENIVIPNCGTAACLWGHGLAILHRVKPSAARKTITYDGIDDINHQIAFGLDYNQIARLCLFPLWPTKFRRVMKEGTPAFARQAVRRIEYFIKTGGR